MRSTNGKSWMLRQSSRSRLQMKDGQPYALAGLWEEWKDRKVGTELLTFAVITTDPNEVVEPLHDRMPVIVPVRDYDHCL
jgi:putative SOS response-associated peptidase YedK